MENVRKSTLLTPLGDDARRQYIDARSTYTAWEDARKEAQAVRGGMYWKKQGGGEYLIRTGVRNTQKSLGPRSADNEAIYARFVERKAAAEQRLAELNEAMTRQQRMNRALYVGRAPSLLVAILDALDKAGLSEYFTVVGTHALYAYESAAGVLIAPPEALATQDVDLLWDTRKRLRFVANMRRLDASMLGLLQQVDASFRLRSDQHYTAVNSKGFEVDILRREAIEDDPHPLRLTEDEEDFWVVQARKADTLLNAAPFSAVVVAANGRMARMHTVPPDTFVAFKRWLSAQPDRDPLKTSRDKLQAEIVAGLIEDYLPQFAAR